MGNLVSIRLRIIAAAWMGSVAEPGDLGAACGAPASMSTKPSRMRSE